MLQDVTAFALQYPDLGLESPFAVDEPVVHLSPEEVYPKPPVLYFLFSSKCLKLLGGPYLPVEDLGFRPNLFPSALQALFLRAESVLFLL